LGNEFYGKSQTETKELQEVCRHFDCLETTNFSTYMNRRKSFFIISGKGFSRSVKLTVPGKEQAKNH
jgi:hypothetical protein